MLGMLRSTNQRLMLGVYVCLVVAFGVCRIGVCTWLLVLFIQDLGGFSSEHGGEWFLILSQFTVFVFVWALSYFFMLQELAPLISQMRAQRRKKAKLRAAQRQQQPPKAKPGGAVTVATPASAQDAL